MRMGLAILVIALSLLVLEGPRAGIDVRHFSVGETPVTSFARADAAGPPIVIAHGFAGSTPMMQGYALPLAKAGYRVFAFDFLGHGQHPLPMSGDVNAIDGTTRLLVTQTRAVIDAVTEDAETVGLLGHSMATDLLVRAAQETAAVGPMVLLSAFSSEIDATRPDDLLLLVGAWEPGLREFAVETAQAAPDDVRRRAVVLPLIEHVSILQSRVGQAEALAWFNAGFGRSESARIWPMGAGIVALFLGLVVLFKQFARRLPKVPVAQAALSARQTLLVLGLPMIVAPPLALVLNPGFMPVLVADYLALHLLIYGAVQLGLLAYWRVPMGGLSVRGFALLAAGCVVFALAINRYAANFWPTDSRVWIIAAMAVGAVLFFVADARLCHLASRRRRILIHVAFLVSLIFAVALDFSGLFFLLMIAPVVVLFYLVFGTMGHAVSNRAGPLAAGLALGLMLAWSLGVSFPLFQG